ncbi:hypothetical protein FB45DRAFT_999645 [Roridomyces roridus]|uniref:F-box domain-containing protein n=1 Tax=Roridomyces roridus TaxID=1738132 RepID=A0AAD7CC76_9AGAR|nr:hypothetical protein FB45DRAFT_999645 [Roridomyces roridus]
MGQYWKIINLDKRETFGCTGKLGAWFFDDSGWLLNSLADPPELPGSTFVKLPNEMIREIFSHLEDIEDILYLSMTCQPMWGLGRHFDYLKNEDIPESLLTPEEREHFGAYESLYQYPFTEVNACTRFWDPLITYNLIGAPSAFIELITPNILRNLSRKQYVPKSALWDWRVKTVPTMKEAEGVCNNEIVLSRICLSSDPSISMSYEGDLHRGAWAGDRFDFDDEEWLDELEEGNGWTDVSDEILKEVEAIWRSEYGG